MNALATPLAILAWLAIALIVIWAIAAVVLVVSWHRNRRRSIAEFEARRAEQERVVPSGRSFRL